MATSEVGHSALYERVMRSTRFGRPLPTFAGMVVKLFGISVEEATRLLTELGTDAAWHPGPAGYRMAPVRLDPPQKPGTHACFLRGPPGARFPRHRHRGWERVFLLQGGFREVGGDCYWAGEEVPRAPGTEHELVILEGGDCILAAISQGIDFI